MQLIQTCTSFCPASVSVPRGHTAVQYQVPCTCTNTQTNFFHSSLISIHHYGKISNTIRTLVQYAPQTFTRELWKNVSLAVQYAPVLYHPSPSMPSATSTKGVSCSITGAGKVTLIDSNCPASRVGQCVDC